MRGTRLEMIVLVNTVNTLTPSRELSLVKTHLQTAQMWAGEYLKVSGEGENPYAKMDGKRETIKDIEPLFDATTATLSGEILNKGRIATIDSIREILNEKIKICHEDLMAFSLGRHDIPDFEMGMKMQTARHQFIVHATEARMWLGMELGRIRDESN